MEDELEVARLVSQEIQENGQLLDERHVMFTRVLVGAVAFVFVFLGVVIALHCFGKI